MTPLASLTPDIHTGADMEASHWGASVAPIAIALSAVGALFWMVISGFRSRLREKDSQLAEMKAQTALLESQARADREQREQVAELMGDLKAIVRQMGGAIYSAHELTLPGTPVSPEVLKSVLKPAMQAKDQSGIFESLR